MRKDREQGAIIVEAILSLTVFLFVIFTILSIANVCYIQAKISVALNSAAKEISQYSYLYYKFDLDKYDAAMAEGTEDERQLADDTINGVGSLMETLTGIASGNGGSLGEIKGDLESEFTNMGNLKDEYADRLAEDPKEFIFAMGKMLGNELKEAGKAKLVCEALGKAFMKKNLTAFPGDDPNNFLLRYRVVDGLDGLDFGYSTFLQNGASNLIQLVVTYDVRMIQLLDIDISFTFRQCVKTTAWGRGISQVDPADSNATPAPEKPASTVWDTSPTERGKYIVAQEKRNYAYTDSHNGYDAYDASKNEFISIISVDPNNKTVSTVKGISDRLDKALKDMKKGVSALGEEIKVTDSSGNQVTLTSNPNTRQYSIVLVVPDNADPQMIQQAVNDFRFKNPGVDVTVRDGYGGASAPTQEETQQ